MKKNKPIRILLADDNPQVRSFLRKALEDNENWKVCCEARNGREVVDQIQEGKPDIVVLDFLMPEMNGLDAARAVSTAWPRVPVLMVTLYPVETTGNGSP